MKLVSSMLLRRAVVAMAALATLVTLTGCWHLAVGPAAPRPNVMLAQDKTPSALLLDPGIVDTFVIPKTGSVNSVPVRGWRATLEAGFQSAFPPGSPTGRKLELIEAELTFAPAAVGFGGTAAVRATVRFKARVQDASGREIGALAGTVAAREANVSASEAGMTDNASKAVEALYEALATELLAKS